MTSSLDAVLSLAHTNSEVMLAVLALATVAGFIAGMFFERSRERSQDNEK